MEDETSKSEKTSALSFVPALGLLGLVIAVIALATGIIAMVKVGDTASDMNSKIEKAAALSLEMKKMSDRIDSIAMQVESIKGGGNSRVDSLAKQTQSAIEGIGRILNENRTAIDENRKAIEEVAKRSVRTPAASTTSTSATSTQAATTETPATQSADGTRTHKIQSGDTFAKLAAKYSTSIDAIVKANPELNPARLKIGQEVAIPAK